jgi:rRNA-processing protein FCF1
MVQLFLDAQSLGLRPYLKRAGITVRGVTEILGSKDTSKSVQDKRIQEFVVSHPELTLVTKDKKFGKRAKKEGVKVIFVDESEAVAVEVLRQLALVRP